MAFLDPQTTGEDEIIGETNYGGALATITGAFYHGNFSGISFYEFELFSSLTTNLVIMGNETNVEVIVKLIMVSHFNHFL